VIAVVARTVPVDDPSATLTRNCTVPAVFLVIVPVADSRAAPSADSVSAGRERVEMAVSAALLLTVTAVEF
jgi:hypothetical protein